MQILRAAVFSLFALTLLALPGISQGLELGGYFEHQFYPQYLAGEVNLLDYNKLRLDLDAEASDNLTFTANLVFQTHHGRTRLNALDFIPQNAISTYANLLGQDLSTIRPFFEIELKDEIYVDNAYLTYYGPGFNARVGKQQLPWGSGYAWNPTDIFHDKNLLDPTYEKRGVNALKLEVPLGGMGQATAVIRPGDTWTASTQAFRLTGHAGGFDVAAMGGRLREPTMDYFSFESSDEQRYVMGGDASGEIAGVGVWIEGAYNWMDQTDDYEELLVGMDYTLESGLYLMSEFYRYGAGAPDMDGYGFDRWMRMVTMDGANVGRHYVLAGNTYPLSDLLTWSNFALVNLGDGSAILYPYVLYSLNDNSEFTLIGYVPIGKDGSEFGSFGAGGVVRLRLYF